MAPSAFMAARMLIYSRRRPGTSTDFKLSGVTLLTRPQMEVQAPPGTTIGYIKQDWHPFVPRFSIQDANKETLMKLEGPCFACNCCGDVNFEVRAKDPFG